MFYALLVLFGFVVGVLITIGILHQRTRAIYVISDNEGCVVSAYENLSAAVKYINRNSEEMYVFCVNVNAGDAQYIGVFTPELVES